MKVFLTNEFTQVVRRSKNSITADSIDCNKTPTFLQTIPAGSPGLP